MKKLKFYAGYDGELYATDFYKDYPIYYDINVYDKYTLNKHVDFGRTVKSRVSEELGEYEYLEDAILAAQKDWKKMNDNS